MAKLALFIDKRSVKKDGTSPIKMRVTIGRGKQIILGTNISLPLDLWDEESQKVLKTCTRYKVYNSVLKSMCVSVENFVMLTKGLKDMTVPELKKRISSAISGNEYKEEDNNEAEKAYIFRDAYNDFCKGIRKKKTEEVYKSTFNKMCAFTDIDSLRLEDITLPWLRSFEAWLSKTSSVNTISIHMRNIRAVMNFAIDEEKTTNYPFRKYRIRTEQTVKRSLSVERLVELRDYPCEKWQEQYRDMFMLIFYLIGINTVDLFHLKDGNVRDGRIEYRREKTGRLYSVKLEPEAKKIIERYKGAGYLINVLDIYKNYADYRHRLNENLQRIGTSKRSGRGGKKEVSPAFPGLTTYWARHTWATLAASLDIPKETIAAALGHELGNRTTSIYIDFDQRKVDEANRKVIDYVNSISSNFKYKYPK